MREILGQEIGQRCALRFGDSVLEIAPTAVVAGSATGTAWLLRVGSPQGGLRAEPASLPFPGQTFECVVVAHATSLPGGAEALVREAARVLAPEGYLFLVEAGACSAEGLAGLRRMLPVGLGRRLHRRWLEASGLDVRAQRALSLLPARLPPAWHRRLGGADMLAAACLPFLGTCVLTIAQRRELQPLTPELRWRWNRMPARAAGTSQWA